jgi:glycosyltransferase involved in cell wall biosynthesis
LNQPAVTVCIPTYNASRFLGQAIDSVLSQDWTDLELLVVDDASEDDTPAICGRYNDPRFRYVRFAANAGQAGNFNRCLELAAGEFLAILHADDYWLPGFLTHRVGWLRLHPEVSFVFGAVRVVDAEDTPVSTNGAWPEDRSLSSREAVEGLLQACIVCPPSLLVRRSAAQRAGPFRADLTWGHDWDWAIRLAETGHVLFHSGLLAAYRVHDGSGTAEQLNAARNGAQERRILLGTLRRLEEGDRTWRALRTPALRALGRRHMYYAEQALLVGRSTAVRHNLAFAARADRWMATRLTFWSLLIGSLGGVTLYRRLLAWRRTVAQLFGGWAG